MRKLILSILLMLSLPGLADNKFEVMPVKKIEANPINVAVMLTEQLDSASLVATLTYYGYQIVSDDASLKTPDLRLTPTPTAPSSDFHLRRQRMESLIPQ